MKVAISQPMYLPWPGLIDQIKNVDVFVHYDDVQLPHGRSFCSRVQIKINEEVSWLTVPVVRKSRRLIKDVYIDDTKKWRKEHLRKIKTAYGSKAFGYDAIEIFEKIIFKDVELLSDLNISFIEEICKYLGLSVDFKKSSDLYLKSNSTQKLIEICKFYGATDYITGHGAKNYLDHNLFVKNGMTVKYIQYNIEPYPQGGSFTPYVTILDLIATMGKQSLNHLKSTLISWEEFIKNE